MKPYLAYKHSEVEWLGELPEHWHLETLKNLTVFISRGNSPDYVDESSISVVNQACIYWDGVHLENIKYQRETNISGWKGLIHLNDLLINSTGTGTLGRAAIFNQSGTFLADSHVTIIRVHPDHLDVRYLFYLLQSRAYQRYIYSTLVSGATNQIELSKEGLRATPTIKPPLVEQGRIVKFLKIKLAEVDSFITNKEVLIKLLKEQKKALTNSVVTHGLIHEVKTKPSSIEWLGEIPEHWELKRAKFYFSEVDERSEAGDEELLSVSHITGVTPRSEKDVTMFMAKSYEGYKTCKPGDLVINIMWAWMGALGVSEYRGIVSSSYGVYRQKHTYFDWRYLDHLLRTRPYIAEFTKNSTGIRSSRLRMYTEDFFRIPIICPPLDEQKRIVQYLEQEHSQIDLAISVAENEIDLIKEFRTALISEAIMGKIDTRAIGSEETLNVSFARQEEEEKSL